MSSRSSKRNKSAHGIRLLRLVDEYLPNTSVDIIFDVGANKGQSLKRYLRHYPRARVLSFEAGAEAFAELSRKYGKKGRAGLHKLALSDSSGWAQMASAEALPGNRITQATRRACAPDKDAGAWVPMEAGDDFCRRQGIDHINLLKVDTEGHDLHVLDGFSSMLSKSAIDIVQVEAGLSHTNKKHVYFVDLINHMVAYEYLPFCIFDQALERDGSPALRRANIAFLSASAREANTIPENKLAKVR